MLTLSEARTLLLRYVGANDGGFTQRTNLVCARMIPSGNWRLTKNRVSFNVFPDALNRAMVTLPVKFNTILAGVVMQPCGDATANYGFPMPVQNGWYSFSPTGMGLNLDSRYNWSAGFVPEEGRFTTFKDWTTPKQIRLKFSTTETNPSYFYVRGNLNGQPVYSGSGTNTIEGIKLTYSGSSPITSAEYFDEAPYEFIKPITNGRVSMYAVDADGETLVAIYDPAETNPGWRRYRVPACAGWTEAEPGRLITICKRAYVAIYNDNDEVIPGNIGALRFGLEALQNEDAQNWGAAKELWDLAESELSKESADDDGAGAMASVQVDDTFGMAAMGSGYGMGEWGGNSGMWGGW